MQSISSGMVLQLHPLDNVAIAKTTLTPGTRLQPGWQFVTALQTIPSGHKIALSDIPAGAPILRYGQVIGFASQGIQPGEHVHVHNVTMEKLSYPLSEDQQVILPQLLPIEKRRTFQGYLRSNGSVGTRNYLAVISTVNCSASVARQIASHFTQERLADYPQVDGVIALTGSYGCGVDIGGENYNLLQRTLAGMANHPNIAGYLLVGLGCETNQASALVENYGLDRLPGNDQFIQPLVIQALGGVRKTVTAGIAALEQMLPYANQARRSPQPVSALTVALQCGGSDSWSGVTANPVVGLVADRLVAQGGTIVLAETPEIYGAEHLLTRRSVNAQVAKKLLEQVRWWEAHTTRLGTALDTNRSPGNEAGGLSTIYEKALGAVAKGGNTPLMAVYGYAEKITRRGLVFMNTPGNDWISVTGQVAGGCNQVIFTTGRGSVFGFKPAPTIKVSSNTPTFLQMQDDMDVNAGKILEGASLEEVADELFDLLIAVASGVRSKSEAQDLGETEFNPWFLGGVL